MSDVKAPNDKRRGFRLLPRFRIRVLLILTAMVALYFTVIPWLERAGKIAYCNYYDMGKSSVVHLPAIGSASCSQCHSKKSDLPRPWITVPPDYRIFINQRELLKSGRMASDYGDEQWVPDETLDQPL